MTKINKNLIKDLVENDKLEKALKELIKLSENTEKVEEFILQLSRLNDLKKSIRLGKVSFENQNIEKNKIRKAILESLKDFSLLEDKEFINEIKNSWKTKLIVLSILCFIIVGVYNLFNYDLNKRIENQAINRNDANVLGNTSMNDTILNQLGSIDKKTEELISILELRAQKINDKFSKHYKGLSKNIYLIKFNKLHKIHISALRNGNIILAHEILIEIHELFYTLEREKRIFLNIYKSELRAHALGDLFYEYTVGKMDRYSKKSRTYYTEFDELFFNGESKNDSIQRDEIEKLYELML